MGPRQQTRGSSVIRGRDAAIWGRRLLVCCFVMLVSSAALAQKDRDLRRLNNDFIRAYQAQDWAQAVTLGIELDRRVPNRPTHQYNVACVFALAGDTDAAIDWLARATRSGFVRVDLLASDHDLDHVRADERFALILEAVERNAQLLQVEIKKRFHETPPLILPPPDHDPARPSAVLIALHGFGDRADGTQLQWRKTAANHGVILVVPQAVRPAGKGYSWHSVDEADTILGLTLDWLVEQASIDRDRIVLTGFSQGGFMALSLATRHPDLFAGVIPVAGGYRAETDAPGPASGDGDPRYYFMVGAHDDGVSQTRQAAKDFREAGYDVELKVLARMGHVFPRETSKQLRRALRFALGETP